MKIQTCLVGTAFKNGYEIVQDKGFAIVGMSPGNSYFRRERIDELLNYCSRVFDHVKIMIADKPMEHTYNAMGYSPENASRRARLNGNTLRNHSQRSIDTILGDVTLVTWKDEIRSHESYRGELSRVLKLYGENDEFRQGVRETTRTVLEGKLKQGVEIEKAINEGVHYLLQELAFLSASPKIFGIDRLVYVYHNRWRVYEQFVDGTFDGQKRSDLGFVVVT
jgi:cyclo(L-tyrosyl-L-tyrosyl) synthase